MLAHDRQDLDAELLDAVELEGVENAQLFSQHSVMCVQRHPGREIVREQPLSIGVSQIIAVGMVVNAVRRDLLDELEQPLLVHGSLAHDFPQLHATHEAKGAPSTPGAHG